MPHTCHISDDGFIHHDNEPGNAVMTKCIYFQQWANNAQDIVGTDSLAFLANNNPFEVHTHVYGRSVKVILS